MFPGCSLKFDRRTTDEVFSLAFGVNQALRTIIPDLPDRIPVTWHNAPYQLACCIPFVFMAYFARRPDTHLIRLLLLPSVLCGILAFACRYVWIIPELNVYNWGQSLIAAVIIAKSLEYAWHIEGMLKIGESRPGVMKGKQSANHPIRHSGHPFIAPWLYDSLELMCTVRGLDWKFGQGIHIPKETKPLDRLPFIRATTMSFVQNFLLLDLLESVIKLFPGVGSPVGGSMFYSNLPPVWRYTVSTLIHMITGTSLLVGFGMVYDLITLLAVLVLNSSPSSWPPILDHPWTADSMHVFWSKRWHQLFRHTFLILGGYPGKWIAGDLGLFFGTFIASGLYHEGSIYTMGRGFDLTVLIFFTLQAPVLIMERMWKRLTGRRVGGLMGRIWVYSIMFLLIANSWHRRGLGGGMVIAPFLSPVRLLLIPNIQRILHGYQH